MKYAKPALTFPKQLDKLISRGLLVADRAYAERCLSHINYYRLAGYLLPFEHDHATHALKPGTTLDDVMGLYNFDRELRLLVLDALERVEVSVRTSWAYHVGHGISPHGYLERTHASSARQYARELAHLEREVSRSSEPFIEHNRRKYTEPDLPPAWVACEVMSLGRLSQWYTLLRPLSLRKQIAATYGLDQQVLESALHQLTYVRNICAHHARLWNREFVLTWKVPRKGSSTLLESFGDKASRKPYNSLCLIAWLLLSISPHSTWRQRLRQLIEDHAPDLEAMGFPQDWQERALWRETRE